MDDGSFGELRSVSTVSAIGGGGFQDLDSNSKLKTPNPKLKTTAAAP